MGIEGFELGLNSFGEVATTSDGRDLSDAETVRLLVEEARLAESVGLDVFSVGEHYREGHNDSATPVLLAAIATATERIRLGTAVTVLSSNDPVRLYHEFATLDAVSNGRAQIVLGRGSATESFPLFGYDLADYEVLFEEKLELFVQLLDEKPVTWSGTTRAPLEHADVYPKTESGRLTTWVGVGGSPQSIIRTARYGLPLMLAIIGGPPERFTPLIELYHRATDRLATTAWPIGMHSPGFIADTDDEAKEILYPRFKVIRDRIGALRGWPPVRREEFDAEVEHGSMYVGSPETVARKIAHTISALGVGRFDLLYTSGSLPISARLRSVELYGTKVIPMVRDILADTPDK